jgi:hypothetical protein
VLTSTSLGFESDADTLEDGSEIGLVSFFVLQYVLFYRRPARYALLGNNVSLQRASLRKRRAIHGRRSIVYSCYANPMICQTHPPGQFGMAHIVTQAGISEEILNSIATKVADAVIPCKTPRSSHIGCANVVRVRVRMIRESWPRL